MPSTSLSVGSVLLISGQCDARESMLGDAFLQKPFNVAELVATARRAGRRPKVQDTWIAATARAHGASVFSQDTDFDELAVEVVRV